MSHDAAQPARASDHQKVISTFELHRRAAREAALYEGRAGSRANAEPVVQRCFSGGASVQLERADYFSDDLRHALAALYRAT